MSTIKYRQPFVPYPLVDNAEATKLSTNADDFVVALGGLVQEKATDKVYRLVTFMPDPSADIDFAANLLVHEVAGTFRYGTGTFQVAQDYSDTNGVVAGVNTTHAIDVSAVSVNQYGYIQVGGECEVTNHDGTCPLNMVLASHGVDGGTTDEGVAGEPGIGIVIADAGTTTPIVRLTIPGIIPVEVNG